MSQTVAAVYIQVNLINELIKTPTHQGKVYL